MSIRENFPDFVESLEGFWEYDGKGKAKCPAHDDNNPSLSMVELSPRKLWVQCHAGCSFSEIVRAAGVPYSAVTKDLLKTDDVMPKWRLVASYVYTDPDGNPAYRVLRYNVLEPAIFNGGKTFRRERWDHEKGWVKGTAGVARYPYHLRDILGNDKPVVVVEGEKACDALRIADDQGEFTWTTFGGASNVFPEAVKYLVGKDVVIIPDNDEPGRKHARLIAGVCVDVGASSVCILHLDGNDKDGPDDWVMRRSFEELAEKIWARVIL